MESPPAVSADRAAAEAVDRERAIDWLVNAIAYCAELGNDHPDLMVSWGRVAVAQSTHSAGGAPTRTAN